MPPPGPVHIHARIELQKLLTIFRTADEPMCDCKCYAPPQAGMIQSAFNCPTEALGIHGI